MDTMNGPSYWTAGRVKTSCKQSPPICPRSFLTLFKFCVKWKSE